MTDFTTLYIPVRIPTADVAALLAAQTGRDDDVVLAAEKAMRKRLAPDMRSGSDQLELDEFKTAAQVDAPAGSSVVISWVVLDKDGCFWDRATRDDKPQQQLDTLNATTPNLAPFTAHREIVVTYREPLS